MAHTAPANGLTSSRAADPAGPARDDLGASQLAEREWDEEELPVWAAARSALEPRPLDPEARAAVREEALRGPRAAAAAAASLEPAWYGESNRAAERRLAAIEELVRLCPDLTEERCAELAARVEADELDMAVYTGWAMALASRQHQAA